MTEQTQGIVAVDRKSLCEGIVEMRISSDAESAELETSQGAIKYLRFKRGIKGGDVPCYVHTDDASIVGRNIRACFTLFERTHADKSKHLHLDLRPTESEATHRLFFLTEEDLRRCAADWPRFATPQVKRGFVVIAPLDAKLKEPLVPIRDPGMDAQLERLLKAGWVIKEDRGATVLLSKPNGMGEKTMVHHRPKK